MNRIREIAQQALESGYLTIDAENRLRQMLKKKYSRRDFEAFMKLQKAAMAGRVKQQSREPILT